MMTILALLTTLTTVPWVDPWQPVDLSIRWPTTPPERWASYWPVRTMPTSIPPAKPTPWLIYPIPIPPAKPVPRELQESSTSRAGHLDTTDFLSQQEADKLHILTAILANDLVATTATHQVLATSTGQRLILSALLCEAQQRKRDLDDLLTRGGNQAFVARQVQIATERERWAQIGLSMGLRPLACNTAPVSKLVQCLSIYASSECTTDVDLEAQMRAAERLTKAQTEEKIDSP